MPCPGSKTERRDYIIPQDTIVNVNMPIIHTNRQYWGDDAFDFRPSRWIRTQAATVNDPSSTSTSSKFDREELFTAASGNFLAWSWGSRICLGLKFSQVEIVAALSTLFADLEVRPALPPSARSSASGPAGVELAKQLAMSAIEDRRVEVAVTTRRPEDLWLKWSKVL